MNLFHGSSATAFATRDSVAERMFTDVAREDMAALCSALGLPDECRRAVPALTAALFTNWGDRLFGYSPPSSSDLTDDGSPFEYSIVLSAGVREVRVLVEPQAEPTTPGTSWQEGWAILRSLAQLGLADLSRAETVADLFMPCGASADFGMWLSACLRPGVPPLFKVYFDPGAGIAGDAGKAVGQAAERLGFSQWESHLGRHLERSHAVPVFFSLDLSAGRNARIKVYAAAPGDTAAELEDFVAPVTGGVAGQATRFCDQVTGPGTVFSLRKPLVCWGLTAGAAGPAETTVHLPVRCYAEDDATVLERVMGMLHPADAIAAEQAARAVSRRDLRAGPGFIAYVSAKLKPGPPHVTMYLSAEGYAYQSGR